MKKSVIVAVLVGAAAVAPRAHAGLSVGIQIGPRYAPPPVVYVAPPIYAPAPRVIVAPAPIVVAAPVCYPPPWYYASPPRPVVVYSHYGYSKHYRPHRQYYRRCD